MHNNFVFFIDGLVSTLVLSSYTRALDIYTNADEVIPLAHAPDACNAEDPIVDHLIDVVSDLKSKVSELTDSLVHAEAFLSAEQKLSDSMARNLGFKTHMFDVERKRRNDLINELRGMPPEDTYVSIEWMIARLS